MHERGGSKKKPVKAPKEKFQKELNMTQKTWNRKEEPRLLIGRLWL